jgi:hypothetical protein
MPFTEEEVLEQLRRNGITTMEELAQRIAKQSDARAKFAAALDLPEGRQSDYVWSGKNYSLYHPELALE